MSRKNREKRLRQAANPPAQKKETVWTIIRDFLKDPVDKKGTRNLGKFLGWVCIGMAICLLFYISGGNI